MVGAVVFEWGKGVSPQAEQLRRGFGSLSVQEVLVLLCLLIKS